MIVTDQRVIEREDVSRTVLTYLRSALVLKDGEAPIRGDEKLEDLFSRGQRTKEAGMASAHEELRAYISTVFDFSLLPHEYDTTEITVCGVTDLIYERVSGGTG